MPWLSVSVSRSSFSRLWRTMILKSHFFLRDSCFWTNKKFTKVNDMPRRPISFFLNINCFKSPPKFSMSIFYWRLVSSKQSILGERNESQAKFVQKAAKKFEIHTLPFQFLIRTSCSKPKTRRPTYLSDFSLSPRHFNNVV